MILLHYICLLYVPPAARAASCVVVRNEAIILLCWYRVEDQVSTEGNGVRVRQAKTENGLIWRSKKNKSLLTCFPIGS